jgi:hypothetical protein
MYSSSEMPGSMFDVAVFSRLPCGHCCVIYNTTTTITSSSSNIDHAAMTTTTTLLCDLYYYYLVVRLIQCPIEGVNKKECNRLSTVYVGRTV